jgi:hypothetical protein
LVLIYCYKKTFTAYRKRRRAIFAHYFIPSAGRFRPYIPGGIAESDRQITKIELVINLTCGRYFLWWRGSHTVDERRAGLLVWIWRQSASFPARRRYFLVHT